MKNWRMSIHSAIKTRRLHLRMSLQDLALKVSQIEGAEHPLSYQTVQQWEKEGGTAPKRKRLASVARALGVHADKLAIGEIAEIASNENAHPPQTDGPVKITILDVYPPPRIMSWEELMGDLPDTFGVKVQDVALEPKMRQGDTVLIRRSETPRPGDGVLIKDADGEHYLRIYRQTRKGEWAAAALNDGYGELDAARHGLVVVGVVVGEVREGRWG